MECRIEEATTAGFHPTFQCGQSGQLETCLLLDVIREHVLQSSLFDIDISKAFRATVRKKDNI